MRHGQGNLPLDFVLCCSGFIHPVLAEYPSLIAKSVGENTVSVLAIHCRVFMVSAAAILW